MKPPFNNYSKQQAPFDPFDMMFGPGPGTYQQGKSSNMPRPPFPFHHQPFPPAQNGLLSQFQKPDGSWDYDKVMNNMNQVIHIAQKAGPLMKQLGPLMSLFKK